MQEFQISGETKARILIGKFIRKHIFTEDFQRGRLSRQKLFKLLNQQIRYYIAPDSGLTVYKCQELSKSIFKSYLELEEYIAYKELVHQARLANLTPEQFFNARLIEQMETARSKIEVEKEDETYA